MLPKSGSPVFFRAGVVVIVVAPTDADLGVSPADAAVAGKARADLLAKIILVAGRRQHVSLCIRRADSMQPVIICDHSAPLAVLVVSRTSALKPHRSISRAPVKFKIPPKFTAQLVDLSRGSD
jgi:antitoxin (DNA-binding transcriptional repressor) of toxin-antitoxin stability system